MKNKISMVCAKCNQSKKEYASTEFLDGAFICKDCYIKLKRWDSSYKGVISNATKQRIL
jgi:late competence protein required for DNA uptake (superfamily II DNA/RNA helicase)